MSEIGQRGGVAAQATAHLRVVDHAPIERELRVRPEPADLKQARDFAAAAATEAGFDDEGRYQFMLAAGETLTNAIEHGLPFSDGCFLLRAIEADDTLSLYISDCGASTWDVSDPGFLSERGRGLGLVQLLMDEVELRPTSDRTTVRLSKRLP